MKLRTFAWTLQAPNAVEHATLTVEDAAVRPYVARLEAGARELGFSFTVYDEGVLPWAVLYGYDAATGQAGAGGCGLPECTTPVGVMP
jgi:hypothetical protein